MSDPGDLKITESASEVGSHRAEQRVIQTDMTSFDEIDDVVDGNTI